MPCRQLGHWWLVHSGCPNVIWDCDKQLVEMCTASVYICQLNSSLFCSAWHSCSNRPRMTRYGQRSFAVSGPTLWNALPSTDTDSVFMRSWSLCCSIKLMKHDLSNSLVTVWVIRSACLRTTTDHRSDCLHPSQNCFDFALHGQCTNGMSTYLHPCKAHFFWRTISFSF